MTFWRWPLVPALIALALTVQGGGEPPPSASAEAPSDYVPGELLVKLSEDAPPVVEVADVVAAGVEGARPVEEIEPLDVARVDLPAGTDVAEAIEQYEGVPWVEYAEPNYYVHATLTPNDTYYNAIPSIGWPGQSWYYNLINGPAAWDETTGDPGILVGVLDTGIDLDHPDLDSKIVSGEVFISFPTSGCTSPPTENDDNGHGTMVSGIVGAETNNGQGVAGTSWGARLMGIKVLDCNGSGTTGDLASGIYYATAAGVDVINMSLSQCVRVPCNTGPCVPPSASSTVQTAVQWAHDADVTLVAAAGNDGCPYVAYPAAFDEVIAVGASDDPPDQDKKASFSNWGSQIDVAAPGVGICTTIIGWYGCGNGTSFSTPLVAGLSALILSQNPNYTPEEVRAVLCATAVNLPDGSTPNWDGCGRVNMASTVTLAGSCAEPSSGDYDADLLGDECDEVDDLKATHWATDYVIALRDAGITSGCLNSPPLWLYCPSSFATRAEIAVMLVQAMGLEPVASPTGIFSDVPPSHWAAGYIEALYPQVTGGCAVSPLRFCPSAYVTRAEIATLILKAIGHGDPAHLGSYQTLFADVPAGLWYTAFVEHLYSPHAITGGCSVSPLKFCPGNKVTRAELAVFIVRAWELPLPA
jgi:thermitase